MKTSLYAMVLLLFFSCQKNKQQTDAPAEAAFDQAAEKKP